jgi:type IV pilus assembly protein PilC
MIRAGEMSGTVPEILERLVFIMEHEAKVKADIKAALQYPIIVIIALIVAFTVLLTFVIPKFADIFLKANLTLPLPTRISIGLYNFVGTYWVIILPLLVVAGIVMIRYLRTDGGRLALDRFLIGLPILGTLFLKSAISRLASILSMLHSSGLDIMTAIKIATDTIGNRALSQELEQVSQSMKEGQGIARPLRQARYFPPMVVDMFAIGEESGRLDEMLREVSEHYDYEVAYEIKRISEALGPILIVGLAAVVGFFALAIFLPMWDLTRMTG